MTVPPSRVPLNILIGPKGKERIAASAHEHHVTMSDVARAAIGIAYRHPEELNRALEIIKEQR